ncbi:CD44 antigen [Alligator mississippiensis]|uniref:CD44 antigen n=1 Tax=Alligator mississippiensis TaxID=8496 RepID=A0A151MBD9_ALLMI|nr:CD44 antigen [Alligator mississippiensis]
MVKFLLWATFGLCFLKLCEAQTQFNISCRYAGVFHVEKNRRYSLMREDAVVLCRALNSTLPTMEQMEKAYKLGFETCRYGFIEDKIVLPRINPYHLCAANYTGIYVLSSNTTQPYDTYCYNASETRDKACEPIQKLDLSFDNSSLADQNQIVIDNADGSRYTDGVKNPDPTPPVYDNTVGSGSSQDTTTHDDPSLDFSGAGKKEYTSTGPGDENTSMGTTASSIPMGPKDFPGKDSSDPYKQHPTSSSSTSNRFGRRGSHIGDTDTTSFPRQTTTTVIISQPRSAKIPEWLIIVAALVALILILAVCIAVNSRRRCGQKKKLVINNGKGAVEDKKIGGLNGEASKSQEMVHLVHKEQSNDRTGQYDEFLTTDETQNQEADMKTGV